VVTIRGLRHGVSFLIDRLWEFDLVLLYGSLRVVGMSIDVVACGVSIMVERCGLRCV
jgi:hypothetical protein